MEKLTAAVKDIMTSNIISVQENTSLAEVGKIFEENSFHNLPVIDQRGHAVGVLSKSDYSILLDRFTFKKIGNYAEKNRIFFQSLLVEEIMTQNPIKINQAEPINRLLDLFLEHKVRSVIVVDQADKCIGMVTPFDILYYLKRSSALT